MATEEITIFLCGDVMTGRGIDQVLPHPNHPRIFEPYMKSARGYVALAERRNGTIPRPADFPYIWGDALAELARLAPDARIINLETSITASADYWRGKGINYRMHPENVPAIAAAQIDVCAMANNHVLDWGYPGFEETLRTVTDAGMKYAGAGLDLLEAEAPAIIECGAKGRVLVFSCGTESSGIPEEWRATENRPGVNLLPDLSDGTARRFGDRVRTVKRSGDICIASIHWGGNWGYEVPRAHERFAHTLIDGAGIDIVHGHSSHHPMGIEVYRDRPIIYGCGDFINDYEGIGGYEAFRGELSLMYFVRMDPASGRLTGFLMRPMRMKRFRVNRATREEAQWLLDTLGREGEKFGVRVGIDVENTLRLQWE